MQTEWIIAILATVCVVFFLLSKKNPPHKMSAGYNREDGAARNFRLELETVAELAVKKIEEKISRLDYLIEEAQEKSNQLDAKIKLVNNVIAQIKEEKGDFSLHKQKQNNKTQLKKEVRPLAAKGLHPQLGDIGFTETARQKNSPPIIANGGSHYTARNELLNNEKHRVALTMLQEGYNVLDIAKVTGLGKGEIMLLQGLRDKKK